MGKRGGREEGRSKEKRERGSEVEGRHKERERMEGWGKVEEEREVGMEEKSGRKR